MSIEPLVPLSHSLKQSHKFQSISDKILLNLKAIPDIDNEKLAYELAEFVCNLIELYAKHSYKINKENLFFFTLNRIVQLTPEEMELIKKHIKNLWDSGRIKKITAIKRIFHFTKSAIKSKFM